MDFTVVNSQTVTIPGLTGPNGANTMYLTNGEADLVGGLGTIGGVGIIGGVGPTGVGAYAGLIEPTLLPGQFRRAIAIVAPLRLDLAPSPTAGNPPVGGWMLHSAEADWDDESGKIALRFEVAGQGMLWKVAFQVTTFALI